MVVIGVDPDSEAHGIAIYINGKLEHLKSMTLLEIKLWLDENSHHEEIIASVENVCGISASFTATNKRAGLNVKLKMAQHIGMCKQAQVELERLFEQYEIEVKHQKISKQWKKNKAVFELATGWKGRSNEDTRSGAYMGFLEIGKRNAE